MRSSVLAPVEVEYPSEDGKPAAESDFHLNVLISPASGCGSGSATIASATTCTWPAT